VRVGREDPAVYEQKQARALDIIRTRKVWFLYAVDEEIEGEYILAAPEITGETVPDDILARLVLRAAGDTIRELREELGDV
jgi:hypothetical protein